MSFTFRPNPPVHRPRDLPALRDWLVDQWSTGDFRKATELGVFGNSGDDTVYANSEAKGCERASLFWLTGDMCALFNAVTKSMPTDTVLNEALLIDQAHTCGLVWFEESMMGTDAHSGVPIKIDAMLWNPIKYPYQGNAVPGIGLSWYQFDPDPDVLLPLGRSDWLLGSRIDDDATVQLGLAEGFVLPEWEESYREAAIEDRKALASLLALCTQRNLSTVEHDSLDRATRRRREREGRPASTVRIIHLRAPQSHSDDSGEKTERNYTHRWIVDPHWRQQPYGPNRSLRRPQLIPAHVKGPKDAPLIVKDKVRVIE